MLPWMLQSHLFPNIAILMASVVQVLEKGDEAPEFSSEPLAIKVKVLGMINRVLGSGQYDLSDVLRSVINLVIIEVSSGAVPVLLFLASIVSCVLNYMTDWE